MFLPKIVDVEMEIGETEGEQPEFVIYYLGARAKTQDHPWC